MSYTSADLDLADKHVAQAERHVVRQKQIVDALAANGYPTALAVELLHTFRLTLETHRRHRDQIAADVLSAKTVNHDRRSERQTDRGLDMSPVAGAANVEIRSETPADVQTIEAVTTSAFLHAPHTSHTEQYIVNALRRTGRLTVSLVAEADGTVIGHVAISPVSVSDGASGWFGLGPISVLPQHQLQGVGSQLMREALRILRERGASGCVVLGDPAYYGRFGFQANPNLVLPGVPPKYFQVTSFGSSKPRGTVTYHKAFEVQG